MAASVTSGYDQRLSFGGPSVSRWVWEECCNEHGYKMEDPEKVKQNCSCAGHRWSRSAASSGPSSYSASPSDLEIRMQDMENLYDQLTATIGHLRQEVQALRDELQSWYDWYE